MVNFTHNTRNIFHDAKHRQAGDIRQILQKREYLTNRCRSRLHLYNPKTRNTLDFQLIFRSQRTMLLTLDGMTRREPVFPAKPSEADIIVGLEERKMRAGKICRLFANAR
jgi:hypothetical protein